MRRTMSMHATLRQSYGAGDLSRRLAGLVEIVDTLGDGAPQRSVCAAPGEGDVDALAALVVDDEQLAHLVGGFAADSFNQPVTVACLRRDVNSRAADARRDRDRGRLAGYGCDLGQHGGQRRHTRCPDVVMAIVSVRAPSVRFHTTLSDVERFPA